MEVKTMRPRESVHISSSTHWRLNACGCVCKHISINHAVTWQHGGGAYLTKKEAAADEEGDAVVDVLVTGTGSPAWLELLSLQGVRVLPLVLVMVVTGASKAVTSLSEFPINPWACVHTDTEIRPQPPLNGFTTPAHLPSTLFAPPLPQMDGQLLQPVPVSGRQQYPKIAPHRTARMRDHSLILATLTRFLWLQPTVIKW